MSGPVGGPGRNRAARVVLAPLLVLPLLIASLGLTGPHRASAVVPAAGVSGDLGCGNAEITRTLSTGSSWRMCVRIHPFKGLVLEQVQFRPATGDREFPGWMPVIHSLYLAQLNVPYDTGRISFNDITDIGFGDDQLIIQTPATCAGETLDVEQSFLRGTRLVERTIPGICVRETDGGLGWHSQVGSSSEDSYTQQSRALEISSLSKTGWYEYQQRITLTDQGVITVGLGATGDLAPGTLFSAADPALGWQTGDAGSADEEDHHAASHWHNAIYRVDFGIDTGPQQVQQWDYHADTDGRVIRGQATVQHHAFAAIDPDSTTWWRVLNPASLNPDGHPRSYEIIDDNVSDPYQPLTRPVVSFTNDHPCQEYASRNLNAECPGQSIADYVADETEPLTDPVAWVNVGFHHIVRDEDQSPMPSHWQAFSLVPRDLLAQQATTPVELSCDNGFNPGLYGSCAASNLTPPMIAAHTAIPRPGTLLTADVGTWRSSRAPLAFAFLWLRDDRAILTTGQDGLPVAATGDHYRVTSADAGHRLAVRVTGSGAGIIPGSATSAALLIPAPLVTPPPRTRPKLKVKVLRGHGRHARPRLRVVLRGNHGTVTGRVRVRRHGTKIRAHRLSHGRAQMRLPRTHGPRYRVKVIYTGTTRYRKVKRTVWVRPPRPAR